MYPKQKLKNKKQKTKTKTTTSMFLTKSYSAENTIQGTSCCSLTQLCPTLCNPMDCSMPGFPVLHHLLGFAQTHVHLVADAIQPSLPLSPTSLPATQSFPASGSFPMNQPFASQN